MSRVLCPGVHALCIHASPVSQCYAHLPARGADLRRGKTPRQHHSAASASAAQPCQCSPLELATDAVASATKRCVGKRGRACIVSRGSKQREGEQDMRQKQRSSWEEHAQEQEEKRHGWEDGNQTGNIHHRVRGGSVAVCGRSDILEVDRHGLDRAPSSHHHTDYAHYTHEQSSNDLMGIVSHDRSHDPPACTELLLRPCASQHPARVKS